MMSCLDKEQQSKLDYLTRFMSRWPIFMNGTEHRYQVLQKSMRPRTCRPVMFVLAVCRLLRCSLDSFLSHECAQLLGRIVEEELAELLKEIPGGVDGDREWNLVSQRTSCC